MAAIRKSIALGRSRPTVPSSAELFYDDGTIERKLSRNLARAQKEEVASINEQNKIAREHVLQDIALKSRVDTFPPRLVIPSVESELVEELRRQKSNLMKSCAEDGSAKLSEIVIDLKMLKLMTDKELDELKEDRRERLRRHRRRTKERQIQSRLRRAVEEEDAKLRYEAKLRAEREWAERQQRVEAVAIARSYSMKKFDAKRFHPAFAGYSAEPRGVPLFDAALTSPVFFGHVTFLAQGAVQAQSTSRGAGFHPACLGYVAIPKRSDCISPVFFGPYFSRTLVVGERAIDYVGPMGPPRILNPLQLRRCVEGNDAEVATSVVSSEEIGSQKFTDEAAERQRLKASSDDLEAKKYARASGYKKLPSQKQAELFALMEMRFSPDAKRRCAVCFGEGMHGCPGCYSPQWALQRPPSKGSVAPGGESTDRGTCVDVNFELDESIEFLGAAETAKLVEKGEVAPASGPTDPVFKKGGKGSGTRELDLARARAKQRRNVAREMRRNAAGSAVAERTLPLISKETLAADNPNPASRGNNRPEDNGAVVRLQSTHFPLLVIHPSGQEIVESSANFSHHSLAFNRNCSREHGPTNGCISLTKSNARSYTSGAEDTSEEHKQVAEGDATSRKGSRSRRRGGLARALARKYAMTERRAAAELQAAGERNNVEKTFFRRQQLHSNQLQLLEQRQVQQKPSEEVLLMTMTAGITKVMESPTAGSPRVSARSEAKIPSFVTVDNEEILDGGQSAECVPLFSLLPHSDVLANDSVGSARTSLSGSIISKLSALATQKTERERAEIFRAAKAAALEQAEIAAKRRRDREEAEHSEDRRMESRGAVVRHRAYAHNYIKLLIKAMPSGRVMSLVVDRGSTVEYLYDLYRLNLPRNLMHIFLYLPTSTGTFYISDARVADSDTRTGAKDALRYLSDWHLVHPDLPYALLETPRANCGAVASVLSAYLEHNTMHAHRGKFLAADAARQDRSNKQGPKIGSASLTSSAGAKSGTGGYGAIKGPSMEQPVVNIGALGILTIDLRTRGNVQAREKEHNRLYTEGGAIVSTAGYQSLGDRRLGISFDLNLADLAVELAASAEAEVAAAVTSLHLGRMGNGGWRKGCAELAEDEVQRELVKSFQASYLHPQCIVPFIFGEHSSKTPTGFILEQSISKFLAEEEKAQYGIELASSKGENMTDFSRKMERWGDNIRRSRGNIRRNRREERAFLALKLALLKGGLEGLRELWSVMKLMYELNLDLSLSAPPATAMMLADLRKRAAALAVPLLVPKSHHALPQGGKESLKGSSSGDDGRMTAIETDRRQSGETSPYPNVGITAVSAPTDDILLRTAYPVAFVSGRPVLVLGEMSFRGGEGRIAASALAVATSTAVTLRSDASRRDHGRINADAESDSALSSASSLSWSSRADEDESGERPAHKDAQEAAAFWYGLDLGSLDEAKAAGGVSKWAAMFNDYEAGLCPDEANQGGFGGVGGAQPHGSIDSRWLSGEETGWMRCTRDMFMPPFDGGSCGWHIIVGQMHEAIVGTIATSAAAELAKYNAMVRTVTEYDGLLDPRVQDEWVALLEQQELRCACDGRRVLASAAKKLRSFILEKKTRVRLRADDALDDLLNEEGDALLALQDKQENEPLLGGWGKVASKTLVSRNPKMKQA